MYILLIIDCHTFVPVGYMTHSCIWTGPPEDQAICSKQINISLCKFDDQWDDQSRKVKNFSKDSMILSKVSEN